MPVNSEREATPNNQFISLSEQLLYRVKTETPTDSLELAISKIDMTELIAGLSNDNARKTFWINIYNAWFQILSTREKKTKPEIFTGKLITIAGTKFSLDNIEHGILRKYRWKYSLGYLPQFCPSSTIKQLSVSKIDYRIHFALNCGAKSCPPIAFYKYEHVDDQLEMAASSFITSETEIDEVKKVVKVSKIMQWFKGDFNGNKGIREILAKYLARDFATYKIEFKEYDWNEQLKNFTTENKTQSYAP
jgi:hypothetical protein